MLRYKIGINREGKPQEAINELTFRWKIVNTECMHARMYVTTNNIAVVISVSDHIRQSNFL